MAIPNEPEIIVYNLVWDPVQLLWIAQQQP